MAVVVGSGESRAVIVRERVPVRTVEQKTDVLAVPDRPAPGIAVDADTQRTVEVSSPGVQGLKGDPGDAAVVKLLASGTVSALRAVVAAGGVARYPNMAVAEDVAAVAGMSVTAAADGGQVSVLTAGLWSDAGWAWSPGPIFCGADGVLTQSAPLGAVLIVGRALNATTVLIAVQIPLLRK